MAKPFPVSIEIRRPWTGAPGGRGTELEAGIKNQRENASSVLGIALNWKSSLGRGRTVPLVQPEATSHACHGNPVLPSSGACSGTLLSRVSVRIARRVMLTMVHCPVRAREAGCFHLCSMRLCLMSVSHSMNYPTQKCAKSVGLVPLHLPFAPSCVLPREADRHLTHQHPCPHQSSVSPCFTDVSTI